MCGERRFGRDIDDCLIAVVRKDKRTASKLGREQDDIVANMPPVFAVLVGLSKPANTVFRMMALLLVRKKAETTLCQRGFIVTLLEKTHCDPFS